MSCLINSVKHVDYYHTIPFLTITMALDQLDFQGSTLSTLEHDF